MNKNTLLITSLAVAALVVFAYLVSKPLLPLEQPLATPGATPPQSGNTPTSSPTTPTSSPLISPSPSAVPSNAPAPKTHRIIMDAKGFTPSNLMIHVGDTVIFENKDTRERWPASDLHPTHILCLGFDSQGSVSPGGAYSYTFTEVNVCAMHDHLFPKLIGSITVEP